MKAAVWERRSGGPSVGAARRPAAHGQDHPVGNMAGLLLDLQRSAGNAAVARFVQRDDRAGGGTGASADGGGEAAVAAGPEQWTRTELRALQRQLRRLRLYRLRIDGLFGPGTEQGLVEAFGGDEWRSLGPVVILERLRAAQASRSGGTGIRYGELFRDGVLDLTIGVGFTEETEADGRLTYLAVVDEIDGALQGGASGVRFTRDTASASRIMRDAGRPLGQSAFGRFYVAENAILYTPPAGPARPIHIVVRMVANESGSDGGAARQAFSEGMTGGDVAYYSGHGRYGSGPDFDRNFATFELLSPQGAVLQTITDYTVLEHELRRLAPRRNPFQEFLRRHRNGTLRADLSNAGNLRLGRANRHGREFGARLIYWALEQTGNTPATGSGNELAEGAAAARDRRYRIHVFDGCRTQDYVRDIRSTPGFDRRTTDVIATTRSVGFRAEAEALMAFIAQVVGQQSAEQVIRGMNQEMARHEEGHTGRAPFRGFGLEDNPR